MSNISLSYFYDRLGLNSGDFKIYYNWGVTGLKSGISPRQVNSLPYADSRYSGLYTGGYVQIKNETGLISNNRAMFFSFSKTGSGNGVLFSNYSTSNLGTLSLRGFRNSSGEIDIYSDVNYDYTFDGDIRWTTTGNNNAQIIVYPGIIGSHLNIDFGEEEGWELVWSCISKYPPTGRYFWDDNEQEVFPYLTGYIAGTGTITSYYPPSGFLIGITDTNRLFFETNEFGVPTIFIGSRELNKKNLICVSNSNNYIQFSYFNPSSFKVFGEGFYLNDTGLKDSLTGWYLTKAVNLWSGVTFNPYKETLYEFCYISHFPTPKEIQSLFSGFYTETGVINSGYISGLKGKGFSLNTGSVLVEKGNRLIYNNSNLFEA